MINGELIFKVGAPLLSGAALCYSLLKRDIPARGKVIARNGNAPLYWWGIYIIGAFFCFSLWFVLTR